MRYLLVIVVLGAVLRVALVRRFVAAKLVKLMEKMMERFMPRMMDICFAQMSPARREFMLAHCRGALDVMDRKYVRPDAA